jgi:hypothetical protein
MVTQKTDAQNRDEVPFVVFDVPVGKCWKVNVATPAPARNQMIDKQLAIGRENIASEGYIRILCCPFCCP